MSDLKLLLGIIAFIALAMAATFTWYGWADSFERNPAPTVDTVHNADGSTCYISHGGFGSRSISCVMPTRGAQ